MFDRLILLLPGTIDYTKFKNFFQKNDYIIAVDGGIEHSSLLNIEPHLWVGDFDSCQENSQTIFAHIPTEVFPTDKDLLDTEIALNKAVSLNISDCVMIGGTGGRLDHQLSLFMILLNHPDLQIFHTDGLTELYSLNHKIQRILEAKSFKHVSIIPITTLENVSISNVKWPLHNVILKPGKGFSISNEPTERFIHYSQEQGLGWIVMTH
ncbi:thiamine diphosphokinase [Wohlfahrtiimonas larvae]|uniref:Thiamine diphosphokinase n=1 Tax=Wohlfahrtiimonas larvae TaxID=1157986 RepID=A0ABP9MIG5_9GAMM|nr:thiamine diphosphokinase [Wohlfahrtiimonas larvae]